MDLDLDRIDKEILLFVGNREVRYRDMLNYLVNEDLSKRICNKVPFLKHRKKLIREGWLKLKRPFYYVPVELHSELKKMAIRENLKNDINNIDDLEKLENLRRNFEQLVQMSYGGSLAWGISVSLNKDGHPLIETANITPDLDQLIEKAEKGEEAVIELSVGSGLRKLMERFNKFVEQNCERCEYGLFANEKALQAGAPDQWCNLFGCEIQPKEFNPAIFADGCKYLKKKDSKANKGVL